MIDVQKFYIAHTKKYILCYPDSEIRYLWQVKDTNSFRLLLVYINKNDGNIHVDQHYKRLKSNADKK
jgi:hypothetical protein